MLNRKDFLYYTSSGARIHSLSPGRNFFFLNMGGEPAAMECQIKTNKKEQFTDRFIFTLPSTPALAPSQLNSQRT